MEKENLQYLLMNKDYYSVNDLRYNQKIGIMLSKDEFEEFLNIKDKLIEDNFEFIMLTPQGEKFNQKTAVELSKKYSTDKSYSFINGVLAKVIK